MVLATQAFTSRKRLVLALILLALLACLALAACVYEALNGTVLPTQVEVKTSDYLVWHRLESGSSELDSLTESLRLFSTIADKLASDAHLRASN